MKRIKHLGLTSFLLFLLTVVFTSPLLHAGTPSRPLLLAQKTSNSQVTKEAPTEDSEGDEEEIIDIDIPESTGNNNSTVKEDAGDGKTSRLQGKFYSWLATGLKDADQNAFYFNYNRLELDFTQLYQSISFHVKANARYNSLYNNSEDAYRRGENLRFDMTEAYIDYEKYPGSFLKQFNLRLGIQTINWGKADEVRPTDILSPQDYTLFSAEDRNDRKLGRFAIKPTLNFGERFRLEALWMPIQRASEATFEEESVFTSRALLNLFDAGFDMAGFDMPQRKLSHSDVALKGYFNLAGTDFSFSFYNGYDPTPVLEIMPATDYDNDGDTQDLRARLSRVTMWGFDFERVIGSLVFRGEVAYFSKGKLFRAPLFHPVLEPKYEGNGYLAEKEYLDATVGFDKNDFLLPKMYLNIQYSYNHIFHWEEGLLQAAGTKLSKDNHTLIGDIYYEWDNLTYRLELAGSYNFSQEDYSLSPSFHIKLGIETKLILGAYLFGGSKDTTLGQYKDKSFGYIQLEHLF